MASGPGHLPPAAGVLFKQPTTSPSPYPARGCSADTASQGPTVPGSRDLDPILPSWPQQPRPGMCQSLPGTLGSSRAEPGCAGHLSVQCLVLAGRSSGSCQLRSNGAGIGAVKGTTANVRVGARSHRAQPGRSLYCHTIPSLPRSSALRNPRPSRGSLLCGGHCPPTACCTRNCARGAAEQGPLGLTGFQAQLRPEHHLQRGRETLRTTAWSPDPAAQGGDLSLFRACLSLGAEASGQETSPACSLLSQRGSRWGSCRPSLPDLCGQTHLCHSSP